MNDEREGDRGGNVTKFYNAAATLIHFDRRFIAVMDRASLRTLRFNHAKTTGVKDSRHIKTGI